VRTFVSTVTVALVASLATGGALANPSPVVRGPSDENHATAGWNRAGTIEYVAFTRRDPGTDRRSAILRLIRSDGSFRSVQLNTRRDGDVGGIFHSRRVLYSERAGGDHDLWVYDILTGRRSSLTGVNTRRSEWLATRSGPYVLFNRDNGSANRVILHDLRNSSEKILARSPDQNAFAGQVSGNWAVWTDCAAVCDVYKHDIAAGTTTIVPRPDADPAVRQYEPSVTRDGTVYLVRSGEETCDSTVELVRFGSSDSPEGMVIGQVGAGRFTTGTYARRNPGGSVDLFFARGSCDTFRHDVFKLRVPD
jgi:hypothetical protein